MKKWLLGSVLLAIGLSGCDPDWYKPKSAVAPPAEIGLSQDEIWTRVTPHLGISVSGSGTSADPYVYNVPMNLNLNGHSISVHGFQGAGSLGPSVCAIFHVNGSISGGGSIDVSSQNRLGGKLTVTATGGMRLRSLTTGGGKDGQGGEVSLDAGGPVQLSGYINTAGNSSAGDVKIQCPSLSIGQYNGCSIFCSAAGSGSSQWPGQGKAPRAGNVTIDCPGPVSLAGGISASGGSGGKVVIRGNQGGTCQAVRIGGDVDIAARESERAKLSVSADSLFVGGNVLAQGQTAPGGEIDVTCAGDCRIRGYVRTDSASAAAGHVRLRARHIWVEGKGRDGWSIYAKPGSARQSQSGDGDVILQCVDTSQFRFDPSNPLNGATSSVFVAGRIITGYAGLNLLGQVYVEAVEVVLGGDVQIGTSKERTLEVHYGTNRFGYTHLVEGGVRWDGRSEHTIRYGAAVPDFLSDVAYAGVGG